jgi:hypothetical protein
MSAQGATLGRGTLHLPIWPVAALVAAAAAVTIGMTLIDVRPEASVTPVTLTEQLANSSAALREQPAAAVTIEGLNPAAIEGSFAAVREQGASRTGVWGISHVTPAEATFAGFEYPGAYVAPAPTYASGLENPGAYQPNAISGKAEPHDPIVVDGRACPQCR